MFIFIIHNIFIFCLSVALAAHAIKYQYFARNLLKRLLIIAIFVNVFKKQIVKY